MADIGMEDAVAEHIQSPSNPDAQAIVTDFIDYTEFFPSDLIRSLTLIGKLDERFDDASEKVHGLTQTYGKLLDIPASQRPAAPALRRDISLALENAVHSRLCGLAEAERLYEVTERHCRRLATIKRKLQALPEPPSRDPTPPPVSSQATRDRRLDLDRTPRLTINMDGARNSRIGTSANKPKHRSSRITIPGEVLPPPNPDSPPPSTISDWDESPPGSPSNTQGSKLNDHGSHRDRDRNGRIKIRAPKNPKVPRVRAPGVMGTNVHSQVAGISTSNALAQLSPPPVDSKPGSRFAPWFRLTDYEMAVLRKKMKKNAIWSPSDTMIRRELARHGRGRENYELAKANAESTTDLFLDEEPLDSARNVGESGIDAWSKEDTQLVNRGMKLNEAKKLKKECLAREQAARDLLEIEEASRKIVETGSMFKNLFDNATPTTPGSNGISLGSPSTQRKDSFRRDRKRKFEESPESTKKLDSNDLATAAAGLEITPRGPKKIKLTSVGLSATKHSPASPAVTSIGYDIPSPASEGISPTSAVASQRSSSHSRQMTDQYESAIYDDSRRNSLVSQASEGIEIAEHIRVSNAPHSLKIPIKLPALITNVSSPGTKTITTSTQIPLGPAGTGASVAGSSRRQTPALPSPSEPKKIGPGPSIVATAAASRSRRQSSKAGSPDHSAPPSTILTLTTRPRSRGGSGGASVKAASVEPPSKRDLRRGSNSSLPAVTEAAPPSVLRTTTRTNRKPAPAGTLTAEEGGTKVAATVRKRGQKGGKRLPKDSAMEDIPEDIDPNEPRYCICNDVSWGTMVACENDNCDKEWFHLECVGLTEKPPRRGKWYCPECRDKLRIDEKGHPMPVPLSTKRGGRP